MQPRKLMLRVIVGGRVENPKWKNSDFKKPLVIETYLHEERSMYKHVLAMNYVHRKADEGIDVDYADVIKSKKLLADQVEHEGITSVDCFGKVLRDLKSKHSRNRQSAARWFAMIITDQTIFGADAIVNSVRMLVANLCNESRCALYEIGFSPKEIGKMKLCSTAEQSRRMIEMLRAKRFLKRGIVNEKTKVSSN